MSLTLAFALLLGPPKLPPLPGRAMPAAPAEAAPTSLPDDPPAREPDAVKSPPTGAAKPGVVPPPPPPPPATTPPAAAPTKAASRSSSGAPPSSIASAIFPGAKAPTPPPPPAGKPVVAASGAPATPMRLVSAGEVTAWDSDDAKARAAAPKPTSSPAADSRDATIRRTAVPDKPDDRLTFRRAPHPPRRSAAFVLGYRYFRIADSLGRPQDWHVASLEVAPVRRYVRVNLITEFGVEGGPAARAGDRADLLLMERLGIGAQIPGVITPFVEFQGGVGGARVELFGRNDLALLYTLGLDLGAQFAVTRWMYLHTAIGWIRPTFKLPERSSTFDRVAFKVGIGF